MQNIKSDNMSSERWSVAIIIYIILNGQVKSMHLLQNKVYKRKVFMLSILH